MKKSLLALFIIITNLFALPAYAAHQILVIGDSLSAGYGIDPQKGWVSLLQERITTQKLPYTVINNSISGDTTSNGLARLPRALKQYQPAITIIELGGNDGLRGLSLSLIKQNLSQMIKLAQQLHSQVVLIGLRLPPNYGQMYTEQFSTIYHTLAEQYRIPLVKLFLQNIDDKPALMQADQIHPTVAAQSILLDNVWPVLSPLLTATTPAKT